MNTLKTFAVAAILTFTATAAQATTIVTTQQAQKVYNAGSIGSVNAPLTTSGLTGKTIDGGVTLDLSNVTYWADGWYNTTTKAPTGYGSRGKTSRQELTESIDSWTFTLSHEGKSTTFDNTATGHELFGGESATFSTDIFDGLVAGGEWVLTAATDYWKTGKRMVQFDAAIIANLLTTPTGGTPTGGTPTGGTPTGGTPTGGGQVPVPATLLLILSGMGLVARKRRAVA